MTNGEIFKTVSERSEAYLRFCRSQDQCDKCKLHRVLEDNEAVVCAFKWLDIEFTEEPKPCPFCGGKAKVASGIHEGGEYYWVECTECYGRSVGTSLAGKTIAAWNRRVS